MNTKSLFAAVVGVGFLLGCAATIPKELVKAREAYQRASTGVASREAPAQVHVAHEALLRAEQAFRFDPESKTTRDLVRVALEKAQLAAVMGSLAVDAQDHGEAKEVDKAIQDDRLANPVADANANAVMTDLATIATVKMNIRGTVITLSGSDLFFKDMFVILDTGKPGLDRVAKALKAQNTGEQIVIEGHTGSLDSDSTNQQVSLSRAIAVRNYLIARGVPEERISAVGLGSRQPIIDNTTVAHRTSNHRIEIIVEREALTTNP